MPKRSWKARQTSARSPAPAATRGERVAVRGKTRIHCEDSERATATEAPTAGCCAAARAAAATTTTAAVVVADEGRTAAATTTTATATTTGSHATERDHADVLETHIERIRIHLEGAGVQLRRFRSFK